ncbi:MAG TPA: GTPase [Tepidisphaeraceae bacterium]|jgi:small GTP-binding protein|nr:GTPase [Tepidisphaeraceae bacterium]
MTPPNTVTLLTPPGVGALAVIRIAGPAVRTFLSEHFTKPPRGGSCVYGQLRDGATGIDDPIVVLGPDQTFADISLHGGPWVVQRTIDLAVRHGFVEHTDTATIDAANELEREVMSAVPTARTELALQALLAQPANWVKLRHEPNPAALQRALDDVALSHLLRVPRVAIVGPANAGKSTLANQLFGVERSITADLAGTTRDWVGEIADINGLAVMLIDTPGLRRTADRIEQRAIELATPQMETADLVIVVLDASRPLEPEQSDILNRYPAAIVVLNKSDLQHDWYDRVPITVATRATTGDGIAELRLTIVRRFACDAIDLTLPRCWTARQRAVVTRSLGDPLHLGQLW